MLYRQQFDLPIAPPKQFNGACIKEHRHGWQPLCESWRGSPTGTYRCGPVPGLPGDAKNNGRP